MSGYDGRTWWSSAAGPGSGGSLSPVGRPISTVAPTVLFIHGCLDDAAVWGGVIAALDHEPNTVTYDLPGLGSRAATVADRDAVSLNSLAAEAGEMLDGIDTVVIVVGQCIGTQIAVSS